MQMGHRLEGVLEICRGGEMDSLRCPEKFEEGSPFNFD